MGRIQLGKEGSERTIIQRFFNRTIWFISTSRNAVIIVVGSVIAYYLTNPDIPMADNPFTLTG